MHIVSAQVKGGDAIIDASSRSGSSVGSTCIIIRSSSSRNSSRRIMSGIPIIMSIIAVILNIINDISIATMNTSRGMISSIIITAIIIVIIIGAIVMTSRFNG